jgi:hypothetical protein
MNAFLGLFTVIGDIIKSRPADVATAVIIAIVFFIMKNDGSIDAMW